MSARERFSTEILPHLDGAYRLARSILGAGPDAEDAVQDAALAAFRALDNLRGADARPWLFAIVRHQAYRRLETRRRDRLSVSLDGGDGDEAGAIEIASEADDAETMLLRAADRDRLLAALATLGPTHREILVLREIEDLPYREIATVTGTAIGTVMSRLARARAALRAALLADDAKDPVDAR